MQKMEIVATGQEEGSKRFCSLFVLAALGLVGLIGALAGFFPGTREPEHEVVLTDKHQSPVIHGNGENVDHAFTFPSSQASVASKPGSDWCVTPASGPHNCSGLGCQPAFNSRVFLYWTGKPSLPKMYEVALKTMLKAYPGKVLIITDSLTEMKWWYPDVWYLDDVTLVDILVKQPEINPMKTQAEAKADWNLMLKTLRGTGVKASFADFIRVAVCYLYGGLYSDFDALWVNPIPWEDVSTRGFHVAVRRDKDKPYKISNGVFGFPHHHPLLREYMINVQKLMNPSKSNTARWGIIGGDLIQVSKEYCEVFDRLRCSRTGKEPSSPREFEYIEMYTVPYDLANNHYQNTFRNDDDLFKGLIEHGWQLHMFGQMTKLVTNVLPAKNSLYDRVCEYLKVYDDPPKCVS